MITSPAAIDVAGLTKPYGDRRVVDRLGPIENITVESWSAGYEVYPGQVLVSLTQGCSAELGLAQATVTALGYAAVAAGISVLLLHRRDVTA